MTGVRQSHHAFDPSDYFVAGRTRRFVDVDESVFDAELHRPVLRTATVASVRYVIGLRNHLPSNRPRQNGLQDVTSSRFVRAFTLLRKVTSRSSAENVDRRCIRTV